MQRLLLLRHGETTAGAGVLLGSRSDPALSARGRAQAAMARERLAGRPIRRVVASPLRRALETAAIAADDRPLTVDERWRELDFGAFTGLRWEEAKTARREEALRWRHEGAAPPGGEAVATLRRRVLEAALGLAADADPGVHQDVLVVTHSTPIRVLVAAASRLPGASLRAVGAHHAGLRVVRLGPDAVARLRSSLAASPARASG